MFPPRRSPASSSRRSSGRPRSRDSSTARWAAARPEMPPPTTASLISAAPAPALGGGAGPPRQRSRPLSHQVDEHGDEVRMVVSGGGPVKSQAQLRRDLASL